MHIKKTLSLAMLLLGMEPVYAQTTGTDTITDRTYGLQDVVVTARKIPASVNAGKPIQLMQKEELELLGLTNLADAVKKFAGVNVRDYGGIGGMKTVSVRNLGAHHTAVSYDGIAISNTQAGQIDISRYQTDNVETISLAVGESDNMMQSARHYASAGVLSITTERPHFDFGKDYSLRFTAKAGSFGMVSPALRYWQKLGQSTTVSVDAAYMRADGMYPFTLVNGAEHTHEKRHNSDIYSWQGEANLYHTFRDSSQLDMKACWYYSQRGLPGAVILYNNKSNERLWDEDFFAQASYSKNLGRTLDFALRGKYTHSWNRYEDTDVKYQDGKQIDVDRQNEYYVSATVGWQPVKLFKLALAEDIAFNDLRNNIGESPNPRRFTSLTALAARLALGQLTVSGNVVGTFATEKVSSGETPEDRKRVSPSVAVSYRLLPTEALYLRAMLKSTFRLPTFNDLYYRRLGNTALSPEKAREYNVGLAWSGQPAQWMKYMSVTVDGYYNNVRDKIVAFPTTYVWKMANFGKVHIYGIDMTLATEVPVNKDMSIMLTAAYTLQKATDQTDPESQYYKNQLPYTPENSGNVSLLFRNPWVNVSYSVVSQGKRYSMAQNLEEYKIAAYSEHTLSFSRDFKLKNSRISLQATILNLTDEQYEIIKYYPMQGRSWYITGKIYL